MSPGHRRCCAYCLNSGGRNGGAAASTPLSLHLLSRIHKGLEEHSVQPQVPRFPGFFDTDRHVEMATHLDDPPRPLLRRCGS